ncbi:uncharacterized protein At1g66480-like [Impatiens glandulifera]|uniref:uncharacterized protein At1g66480-like n=1 Tax=Impatiens glandulifera TaxID=253017 RepID=UPI001FB0B9D9|nr:uncharacterized protein At1g66480-like [Impatiens glandulifera]
MGNTLGGKRIVKVMKINGETIKFKTPIKAGDVTKDYPGHVLLESESVKQLGIRAKPLETWQELRHNHLYFIVELPTNNMVQQKADRPRRVRSGINMTAKDRLESLKMYRRSVSSITVVPSASDIPAEAGGGVRLKMRLPKAEVERLMRESKDEGEAAEKIIGLCMGGGRDGGGEDGKVTHRRHVQWDPEVSRRD